VTTGACSHAQRSHCAKYAAWMVKQQRNTLLVAVCCHVRHALGLHTESMIFRMAARCSGWREEHTSILASSSKVRCSKCGALCVQTDFHVCVLSHVTKLGVHAKLETAHSVSASGLRKDGLLLSRQSSTGCFYTYIKYTSFSVDDQTCLWNFATTSTANRT
jgi:hypothetical protein